MNRAGRTLIKVDPVSLHKCAQAVDKCVRKTYLSAGIVVTVVPC